MKIGGFRSTWDASLALSLANWGTCFGPFFRRSMSLNRFFSAIASTNFNCSAPRIFACVSQGVVESFVGHFDGCTDQGLPDPLGFKPLGFKHSISPDGSGLPVGSRRSGEQLSFGPFSAVSNCSLILPSKNESFPRHF